MSDRRNQLLLCALQRHGEPMASDDLLDSATGLALAEGWTSAQTAELSRRSVAARLRNMEGLGLVRQVGDGFDSRARRATPQYEPTAGYDARAAVPAPPSPAMDRAQALAPAARPAPTDNPQLLALLDVHQDFAEATARFLQDLDRVRAMAKRKLQAAGIDV